MRYADFQKQFQAVFSERAAKLECKLQLQLPNIDRSCRVSCQSLPLLNAQSIRIQNVHPSGGS